ncbi:LamB/YcsF family protein [Nocardia sp. NBC_00403]|uniref:LamB/YcsF family protein n=1 Tax=Nocardia sp. NBC_00403 TaxID=2975990 RepID=UPI002E1C7A97
MKSTKQIFDSLNADVGAGFGKRTVDDAENLSAVSDAGIACGFHADNPDIMRGPVPLLGPEQLLAAIAGHLRRGSPLIGWARELGDLHAAMIPGHLDLSRHPADFDAAGIHADIARIGGEIDSWAVRHVPRTPNVRKHTHSLGEVISHVAKIYADAWWTVLHATDEELRHEAWFHLAEVREGYATLVTDIRARRVQLPLGWCVIRRSPLT